MSKEDLKSIFSSEFKYEVNQELRHRADMKGAMPDMGILVTQRVIIEQENDDGEKTYERLYVCRVVKFSGSGEQVNFKEKELVTVEEFEKARIEREIESRQMQEDARESLRIIFKSFGVEKSSKVYLVKDGVEEKSEKYRVTGMKKDGDLTVLIIRGCDTDTRIEITSKDQIKLISES